VVIAYDTKSNGLWSTGSNFAWNHTIAAKASVILIAVNCYTDVTVTGVKVGGSGGTAASLVNSYTAANPHLYVYALYNPPTGTQSLYVTLSGTPTYAPVGAATSFTGGQGAGAWNSTVNNGSGSTSPQTESGTAITLATTNCITFEVAAGAFTTTGQTSPSLSWSSSQTTRYDYNSATQYRPNIHTSDLAHASSGSYTGSSSETWSGTSKTYGWAYITTEVKAALSVASAGAVGVASSQAGAVTSGTISASGVISIASSGAANVTSGTISASGTIGLSAVASASATSGTVSASGTIGISLITTATIPNITTNQSFTLAPSNYTITMPLTYSSSGTTYAFQRWEDNSTNNIRIVNLTTDTTITAYYATNLDTTGSVGISFSGAATVSSSGIAASDTFGFSLTGSASSTAPYTASPPVPTVGGLYTRKRQRIAKHGKLSQQTLNNLRIYLENKTENA
jgi:hypothetical protein